jgi:hypothetical protein
VLPDYPDYAQVAGLDWYEVDPNLRQLLDRLLPQPDDRCFAEDVVGRYGDLVGRRIAARAEVTDKHGPVLVRRPVGQRHRESRPRLESLVLTAP